MKIATADNIAPIIVAVIAGALAFGVTGSQLIGTAEATHANIMEGWAKGELASNIGKACKKNKDKPDFPKGRNLTREFSKAEEITVKERYAGGKKFNWFIQAKNQNGAIIWEAQIGHVRTGWVSSVLSDGRGPCEDIYLYDVNDGDNVAEGPGTLKFRIIDNKGNSNAPGGGYDQDGDPCPDETDDDGNYEISNCNQKDVIQINVYDGR